MPIEVKQLVVKGKFERGNESEGTEVQPAIDLEAYKDEILEACRRMMEEVLRESRER